MAEFPVDTLQNSIFAALEGGARRLVVAAPTGSGKSTRLPVMLSNKLGGRVLVMQPRRVAARMLARGVGELFDMRDEVGWHVRFDKHYTESSKIVFLTEGILARMLLNDPSMRGISAVVFDEFHERNIYADISLALALRVQEKFRPDLAIAVCSASMDSDALMGYLGGRARRFECGTRMFPIDIEYAPPRDRDTPVWENAARQFERLVREEPEGGNFLVFMPGIYEISRTFGRIAQSPAARGIDIFQLYGDLPPQQQDKILSPSARRKVIISTNVAETSLTIEGVRYVIDSGLARVARFDPARGVNTLLVERVSVASATQRAGRAGRTASGRAVRLWRQADEISFEPYTPSEISRLDLSQTLLWLRAENLSFSDLKMFEPPPAEAEARALSILKGLGALDKDGRITRVGRDMALFPTEPRYAKLLIEGARRGCLRKIALIAALTDVGRIKLPVDNAFAEAERDEMVGDVSSEPEELARLCEIARENSFDETFCRKFGVHAANARKAFVLAADLERLGRAHLREAAEAAPVGESVAKCVLGAFSDHLCVRLNKGTLAFRMSGGKGGEIRRDSRFYADDIFCAVELQERDVSGGASIMASMIVPVRREYLSEMFPDEFSTSCSVKFDERQKRVVAQSVEMFRDLALSDSSSGKVPPDEAAKILRDEIFSGRLSLRNFDEGAQDYIERVNFVALNFPEYEIPAIDEAAKSEIFEQMCFGCVSYSEVKDLDVHSALREWLSREQNGLLKHLTPREVQINPNRRPAQICYDAKSGRAVISASFKDLFSFDASKIRICDGKVRPTFEVLAPNGRPIQTTQNLPEFWKTSWLEIRREVRSRYPKHFKVGDAWHF